MFKKKVSEISLMILLEFICKKSVGMRSYIVNRIKIRRLLKPLQAVLWFYSMQKRHELAGSGLALNYVICSRTVKHCQIKNGASEPLSRIMKSCLFITYGFKYQLCLSLHKFCSAWGKKKKKSCFTKAVVLGWFSTLCQIQKRGIIPFYSNPHYA